MHTHLVPSRLEDGMILDVLDITVIASKLLGLQYLESLLALSNGVPSQFVPKQHIKPHEERRDCHVCNTPYRSCSVSICPRKHALQCIERVEKCVSRFASTDEGPQGIGPLALDVCNEKPGLGAGDRVRGEQSGGWVEVCEELEDDE
jgi:hypothetical protein